MGHRQAQQRLTDQPAAFARAEEYRADARLVTAAAACAARLERVCADWSLERRLDLAFAVAFVQLRAEMAPAEWHELRSRYPRRRSGFDARLVALAAGEAPP